MGYDLMATKTKSLQVTLKGIAVYPNLSQPVEWDNAAKRNVPSDDRQKARYKMGLVIDGETAANFEAKCLEYAQANGIKKPDYTIKEQLDKETGEETGNFIINIQAYGYSSEGAKRRPPALFDAGAKPLPVSFVLTNGSEVNVSVSVLTRQKPKPGLSFWIGAIQVLSLADGPSNNPFEATEGFTYKDEDDDDAPFEAVDGESTSTDF
jgi:hypothetical protein